MDNETASILRAAHLRRFAPKLLACILLLLMFSVVFATPAHAGVLEDLGEILKDPGAWLVDKFLRDPAESLLNTYANTMSAFGTENFLTGSFKSLFGNGEGTDAVWTTINAVHKTLIVPLAGSILSLVMLVQVVKISQRIDSTSTFPAVKEIVFLAVLYVIIRFLILNSIDICAAVFDLFNEITKTIFDSADPDLSPITIPDGVGIGNMFIILIMALLLQLTGFVSVVIAWVMAAARAIQIYILAAFSPIPISLLGFEQTRSMGINFLKNFAAACLAGTIMAFLLTIMPKLCATYIHVGDIVIDGTVSILPFIAPFGLPILLIIGVVKSGAWARDLFGG